MQLVNPGKTEKMVICY